MIFFPLQKAQYLQNCNWNKKLTQKLMFNRQERQSFTDQKVRDVAFDISMSGLLLGKAPSNDKPQVRKMKAIINEYQKKLDQKVSQVITDLINYSKKNNENIGQKNSSNKNVILPEISNPNSYHQNKGLTNHRKSNSIYSYMNNAQNNSNAFANNISSNQKRRSKFISAHNNFNSIQNKSYDQGFNSGFSHISQRNAAISFINNSGHQDLRDFQGVKITEKLNKTEKQTMGRSIGKKIYRKPKPLKREIQILSKEMRWNPFCQKNAIKAHQLDQGMLNLIQKGKVGKDVDIITAFEKGRPILDSKPAIFHHAEQKFNQDQSRIKLPRHLRQKLQSEMSRQQHNQSTDNNAWAITALPLDSIDVEQKEKRNHDQKFVQFNLENTDYLRVLHYKVLQDQNFNKIRRTNFQDWQRIKLILNIICQFLELYTHENVYINFNKVSRMALMVRKPTESQIMKCIVIPKGKSHRSYLKSIRNINNLEKKKRLAAMIVSSCLKANFHRLRYLKGQKKRKFEKKICQWAKNSLIIKNCKRRVIERRQQIQEKYVEMQAKFRQEYCHIVSKKHYQIHLPNKHHWTSQKFKDVLNADIVRIFDLDNINTHIVYLCPFELSQDTMSYYYKIMELQEIPNYKERVTFIEVDSEKKLPFKMSMSQKLYYSSKTIRKLISKVKDSSAYFVISYPSQIDINLSVYLNIPIFSGNLLQLQKFQRRSLLKKNFPNSKMLTMLQLTGGRNSAFQISNQIIRFCESFKQVQRFVIKLDGHYESSGVALLAYPFTSLPEMYSKTTLLSGKHRGVDSFYLKLAKKGGIIQKYDENISPITVVGKIDQTGQSEILGTFEKISYGFVNVGYLFPQKVIPHRLLIQQANIVIEKLKQKQHFGQFQITFFSSKNNQLHLQKVQTYFTRIGASLHYFKFLSDGQFNSLGQFMTKIYENYDEQMQQVQSQMPLQEPRGYCYIPYLLHFGLSQRQASSFFQLCRMGGVSFDLQNKYGSTFILLGNLKSSLGIITIAKERKNIVSLMLNCMDFLAKQNSHNVSNEMLREKDVIGKERTNISSMKQILQGYL